MSWVEYDKFISTSFIKLLVFCKEGVCSEMRIHLTNAINEDEGTNQIVVLRHMLHDTIVDVLVELLLVRFDSQSIEHGCVIFHILLQQVLKVGRILSERHLVQERAKLLE